MVQLPECQSRCTRFESINLKEKIIEVDICPLEVGLFHQALDQTRETFRSFSSVSDNKSKSELGNQVEMIAGLPRMQFDFKSSHTQAPDGADING